MHTVHPDDVLLVRHPKPLTGPFRTVYQCSCHHHPSEPDDDDSSVITYSSYSSCPQRTSYDFTLSDDSNAKNHLSYSTCLQRTGYDLTLSEILPPARQFVHPCEYSNIRSPDRPSCLRRLLAKFGRCRRASKPMGEGVMLRAALSRYPRSNDCR